MAWNNVGVPQFSDTLRAMQSAALLANQSIKDAVSSFKDYQVNKSTNNLYREAAKYADSPEAYNNFLVQVANNDAYNKVKADDWKNLANAFRENVITNYDLNRKAMDSARLQESKDALATYQRAIELAKNSGNVQDILRANKAAVDFANTQKLHPDSLKLANSLDTRKDLASIAATQAATRGSMLRNKGLELDLENKKEYKDAYSIVSNILQSTDPSYVSLALAKHLETVPVELRGIYQTVMKDLNVATDPNYSNYANTFVTQADINGQTSLLNPSKNKSTPIGVNSKEKDVQKAFNEIKSYIPSLIDTNNLLITNNKTQQNKNIQYLQKNPDILSKELATYRNLNETEGVRTFAEQNGFGTDPKTIGDLLDTVHNIQDKIKEETGEKIPVNQILPFLTMGQYKNTFPMWDLFNWNSNNIENSPYFINEKKVKDFFVKNRKNFENVEKLGQKYRQNTANISAAENLNKDLQALNLKVQKLEQDFINKPEMREYVIIELIRTLEALEKLNGKDNSQIRR